MRSKTFDLFLPILRKSLSNENNEVQGIFCCCLCLADSQIVSTMKEGPASSSGSEWSRIATLLVTCFNTSEEKVAQCATVQEVADGDHCF